MHYLDTTIQSFPSKFPLNNPTRKKSQHKSLTHQTKKTDIQIQLTHLRLGLHFMYNAFILCTSSKIVE